MAVVWNQVTSGVVRFYSREEVRKFLKSLVEHYQQQATDYGDRLGGLMRLKEQPKQAQDTSPQDRARQPRGWIRMGSLLVNVSDPLTGSIEMMMQLHDEFKQKLAKATEALKSYEEMASSVIPEGGTYTLQLGNGLPERIVVEQSAQTRQRFTYSSEFRLV
jgi:hypothetical protein